MNTVALTPLIQDSLRQTSLRTLVVEPHAGQLTKLLGQNVDGVTLEVDQELDLSALAARIADQVYDLVIINNLAGDQSLNAEAVKKLQKSSVATPILVLGYDMFMADEKKKGDAGTIRQAAPSHVTASTLAREIRYTLEAHVIARRFKDQEHRMECLQTMFWQMLEHMPYPVLAIDSEGYVVALNRSAQGLWNGPAEKALFTSLSDESLPMDGLTQEKQINGVLYSADFVRIEWLGEDFFLVTLRHKNES